MAALMVALLASAIAALGSRWANLAALTIGARSSAVGWVPVVATAIIASGIAARFGIEVAARYQGPGMLLLLALALAFAVPALLWPIRPVGADVARSVAQPIKATVLLAAAMISDGAPFIIFAVSAWTGVWALAAAGGAAGLVVAVAVARGFGIADMPPATLRWSRLTLGTALLFIALFTALSAFNAR